MYFGQIKSKINYNNLSFKHYKYHTCSVNKICFRNYQYTICYWKLNSASVQFCYLKNHPKIREGKIYESKVYFIQPCTMYCKFCQNIHKSYLLPFILVTGNI